MTATAPLLLLALIAAAVVVLAAFARLERYEEHDIEPCRHCTPGIHWHFGDHCPSTPLGHPTAPRGQAPGPPLAAAQADEVASWLRSSAEFSGGGAVGPRLPAGPSQVHPPPSRDKRPHRRTP